MNWKNVPDKLRDVLLVKKTNGIPVEELAAEIGMRPTTLDRRLREWAGRGKDNDVLSRPPVARKSWATPPAFEENVVITGDYHLPFLDYDFAEVMIKTSEKLLSPPRRLIVAADLFNFDILSRFPKANNYAVPLRTELDMATLFLTEALDVFDNIDVLLGNHEMRVIYLTLGQLGHKELEAIVGVDRVRFHEYPHCIISSASGEWRATHQKNYSRVSQSVGVKLAHKFGQHIITHHQHRVSKGFDTSGKYVVIDNGCMAHPDFFDYVNVPDNTAPSMMQSFVILKDGVGNLFANNAAFTNLGGTK